MRKLDQKAFNRGVDEVLLFKQLRLYFHHLWKLLSNKFKK